MATPVSGTITMFDINSAFNRGNNLNAYRGTVWYQPNSTVTGTFPAGQIAFSDFYNKQGTDPAPPSPPTPTTYVPGTYTFIVPLFRNSLTVTLNAAGGGGGGYGAAGTTGGNSSFSAPTYPLVAYGGGGGGANESRSAGAGGIATGGTVNTSGQSGIPGLVTPGVYPSGGNSGSGAVGGVANYGPPAIYLFTYGSRNDNQVWGGLNGANYGAGGGGVTIRGGKFAQDASGGGGGGYCQRAYTPAQLPAGTSVTLIVGARGIGGNSSYNAAVGYGGNGSAVITWS